MYCWLVSRVLGMHEKEITIQISNTLGQVVLQETTTSQQVNQANNLIKINIQNFQAGMYYLTIKGKDIIEIKKIVLSQ